MDLFAERDRAKHTACECGNHGTVPTIVSAVVLTVVPSASHQTVPSFAQTTSGTRSTNDEYERLQGANARNLRSPFTNSRLSTEPKGGASSVPAAYDWNTDGHAFGCNNGRPQVRIRSHRNC
jgi:hypothetical protein